MKVPIAAVLFQLLGLLVLYGMIRLAVHWSSIRPLLGQHPRRLQLVLLVALGLVAGFALGRLLPDDTVTPKRLTGTVTWSNEESSEIEFDADGDEPTRFYSVVGRHWIDANGTRHSGGYPSCLSGQQDDPVRSDRRRVELGVIYQESYDLAPDIAVSVRCFG
ncbi:hypothetical protein ACFOW4_16180 [Micromonospora sp. GCM10011542]|uniref:hypothetical protein n=1 Tax=Micromonospora sp. GCM10011542 TaxID=3317337 RepID=UPI003617E744